MVCYLSRSFQLIRDASVAAPAPSTLIPTTPSKSARCSCCRFAHPYRSESRTRKMPPRRSKRIKTSKALEPPPEPVKKKAPRGSKPSKKYNRAGGLKDMLEMPLDVIYEVGVFIRHAALSTRGKLTMYYADPDALLPTRPAQPLANFKVIPRIFDASELSTHLERGSGED